MENGKATGNNTSALFPIIHRPSPASIAEVRVNFHGRWLLERSLNMRILANLISTTMRPIYALKPSVIIDDDIQHGFLLYF